MLQATGAGSAGAATAIAAARGAAWTVLAQAGAADIAVMTTTTAAIDPSERMLRIQTSSADHPFRVPGWAVRAAPNGRNLRPGTIPDRIITTMRASH